MQCGSRAPLMNETRRDECVRPARVMTQVSFFHSAGEVHVEISFFAEGTPPGASVGCLPICASVSSPRDVWVPNQPPRPLQAVGRRRSQPRGKPQPGVFFTIHVFTQNSVKSGKTGGVSGKQVSPHFILYESKPPPWTWMENNAPGLGRRPSRRSLHK